MIRIEQEQDTTGREETEIKEQPYKMTINVTSLKGLKANVCDARFFILAKLPFTYESNKDIHRYVRAQKKKKNSVNHPPLLKN